MSPESEVGGDTIEIPDMRIRDFKSNKTQNNGIDNYNYSNSTQNNSYQSSNFSDSNSSNRSYNNSVINSNNNNNSTNNDENNNDKNKIIDLANNLQNCYEKEEKSAEFETDFFLSKINQFKNQNTNNAEVNFSTQLRNLLEDSARIPVK